MKELEGKTVEILEKLDALATQYTPEVMDAAITAVKITAIGNLVWGVFGLVCAGVAWWLTKNFTGYCRVKKQDGGWMSDWQIGWALGFGIGGAVSTFIALFAISSLFEVWNWVAIFEPKLALAHRALGL